jgi:hypothetical protein
VVCLPVLSIRSTAELHYGYVSEKIRRPAALTSPSSSSSASYGCDSCSHSCINDFHLVSLLYPSNFASFNFGKWLATLDANTLENLSAEKQSFNCPLLHRVWKRSPMHLDRYSIFPLPCLTSSRLRDFSLSYRGILGPASQTVTTADAGFAHRRTQPSGDTMKLKLGDISTKGVIWRVSCGNRSLFILLLRSAYSEMAFL